MTDDYEVGYRKPPTATRFAAGRSGNPNGRPKTAKPSGPSPFDVVMDQTLTIQRNGVACEVTPEEALQHTLLQKAFAGDRRAARSVMRMILEREQSRDAARAKLRKVELLAEADDPENANEALVLLGIAEASSYYGGPPRLKVSGWAVQAALHRRGAPRLNAAKLAQIKNRIIGADQVDWPTGVEQ